MMKTSLSIVVTYNPDANIMKSFYEEVARFSNQRETLIELIVVNNLCPENEILDCHFFGEYITIKKLSSNIEAGQAGSIILGFMQACSDLILSIDPDMVSSLNAIDHMLEFADQGYQVVVARRSLRDRPIWRAVSTYFFNIFASFVLGFRVHDLNSPMFLVRKRVVSELSTLELPSEAYKLKLFIDYRARMAEIPVRDYSSKTSAVSTYRLDTLSSLFIKRLWLALKLRLGNK